MPPQATIIKSWHKLYHGGRPPHVITNGIQVRLLPASSSYGNRAYQQEFAINDTSFRANPAQTQAFLGLSAEELDKLTKELVSLEQAQSQVGHPDRQER